MFPGPAPVFENQAPQLAYNRRLQTKLKYKPSMQEQDSLRRFLFEKCGVRGEWVQLTHSLQQAKSRQHFPSPAVEAQLGEALAASALLSATIKFKGALIMQIQGGGDLKALVAQCDHQRRIRGLVRSEAQVAGEHLAHMLGPGARLVITIEPEQGEPYQGIVSVNAPDLAAVLQDYFQRSEQLPSGFWLAADQNQAAGLFLQQLPGTRAEDESAAEDWRRLLALGSSITREELLQLDCETLLHRLFHEEELRLFAPEPVEFYCHCSRGKIGATLLLLGENEINAILAERDDIEVDCQFCGAQYRFDKVDIAQLLAGAAEAPAPASQSLN